MATIYLLVDAPRNIIFLYGICLYKIYKPDIFNCSTSGQNLNVTKIVNDMITLYLETAQCCQQTL